MGYLPGKYIVALAALLFIALLGAKFTYSYTNPLPEAQTIGQGNPDFNTISDRFTKLAEDKGADYAFDVLKIAPLPSGTDIHLLGHAVGNVLYQQKGVEGIKDCTQDFRNACSHAIVIGALGEYGADKAVSLIQAACKEAPGGSGAYTMCFHGLGHGVFADFGYDLPKAVSYCKEMGTAQYGDEEYTECVGGAIMELADGGGHDEQDWLIARQKYFTSDPLSPCDTNLIPGVAKYFCYMYLTPRLFQLAGADINNPDPATFPKAFSFCDALPANDASDRDACFGSFGKEFVPLAGAKDIRHVDQYDNSEYVQAQKWCAMEPSPLTEGQCIRSAVESVFWGGENDPDASFRFCSLITDASKNDCYDEMANMIPMYERGNAKDTLCNELPIANQKTCEAGSGT